MCKYVCRRVCRRVDGCVDGRIGGRISGRIYRRVSWRVDGSVSGSVTRIVFGRVSWRVDGNVSGCVFGERPSGCHGVECLIQLLGNAREIVDFIEYYVIGSGHSLYFSPSTATGSVCGLLYFSPDLNASTGSLYVGCIRSPWIRRG